MKTLFLLILGTISLLASDGFISSSELKNKLENPKLVLLDVTDKETYDAGHIPGAINVNVGAFRYKKESYQLMQSSEKIQKIARSLGIDNDSEIVLYGHGKDKELLKASYIALALIVNGAQNVSLLDGGYADWKFESANVSTKKELTKVGNFTAKFNPDILVDLEYVRLHLAQVPMIEARPLKYFNGLAQSSGVKRLGHIPHAMSSFWKEKFYQDEFVMSKKDLEDIYLNKHKLKASEEVIMYCTGGLEASMNWYIAYKVLGFKKAKVYDASMREWGNRDDTPMALN